VPGKKKKTTETPVNAARCLHLRMCLPVSHPCELPLRSLSLKVRCAQPRAPTDRDPYTQSVTEKHRRTNSHSWSPARLQAPSCLHALDRADNLLERLDALVSRGIRSDDGTHTLYSDRSGKVHKTVQKTIITKPVLTLPPFRNSPVPLLFLYRSWGKKNAALLACTHSKKNSHLRLTL
jgi:hypothetical protein